MYFVKQSLDGPNAYLCRGITDYACNVHARLPELIFKDVIGGSEYVLLINLTLEILVEFHDTHCEFIEETE